MTRTSPGVDTYLERYEAKKAAAGLTLRPPPDKADLGEYAFAPDVIAEILIGVISGVLTEAVLHLVKAAWKKKDDPADTVRDVVAEIGTSTTAIRDGIRKLEGQGVRTDDAKAAVDLLVESVGDVLAESAAAK
jgi:hypothetical protein